MKLWGKVENIGTDIKKNETRRNTEQIFPCDSIVCCLSTNYVIIGYNKKKGQKKPRPKPSAGARRKPA